MRFTAQPQIRRGQQSGEPGRGRQWRPGAVLNLALGGAYPAGYNGVEEPCWGLPQESVDEIAAGGVQAEIDWVRVEQLN